MTTESESPEHDRQPGDGDGGDEQQHVAGNGDGGNGHAVVKGKPEPRKGARDHAHDETADKRALFEWADEVLEDMGLLDELRRAKTREELDAVELDLDDTTLIMAIRNALHPGQ